MRKVLIVDNDDLPSRMRRINAAVGEEAKKVSTPLTDERSKGLTGRIGCPGCGRSNGTLVGIKFECNTKGCKHKRAAVVSPWTKGA